MKRSSPWWFFVLALGGERRANWAAVLGFVLFVGMMATGYFYNITFVQLGLVDLGTRLAAMSEQAVAAQMAAFALITCAVALLFGVLMQRRGWGEQFVVKLRLALLVALAQAPLTAVAPFVRAEAVLFVWIVATSMAIGIGVPVTFSLAVDLVPVRLRGAAGGLISAVAYVPAALLASPWTVERFALLVLPVMLAGIGGLALLLSGRFGLLDALARQHLRPTFAVGRFVHTDASGRASIGRKTLLLIALMFGV
ncbi:MAG: MFS transporter, partial [Chloroflexi bacterium]|nr:MFS transporter [Chloroflexota bacterium]